MKKGWYILNYHNISWEENAILRGVGGTFSPDIFNAHVEVLSRNFKVVGIEEGYEKFKNSKIDEPLLSFWFDDGLYGVRKYALPILNEHSITAGLSINSSLTLKKEIFWRFELSWLHEIGKLQTLSKKLKSEGFKIPKSASLREFTIGNFNHNLRKIIHDEFEINSNENIRRICHEMYDSELGLKVMLDNGWLLANHTASHYPVSEEGQLEMLMPEFKKCEKELLELLGVNPQFWVLPFDRISAKNLNDYFEENVADKSKVLVHVQNRLNYNGMTPRHLYRIYLPHYGAGELIKFLKHIK